MSFLSLVSPAHNKLSFDLFQSFSFKLQHVCVEEQFLSVSLLSHSPLPKSRLFFHRPTYPRPLFQTQVWDWQFLLLLCRDFWPTADLLLSWRLWLCSLWGGCICALVPPWMSALWAVASVGQQQWLPKPPLLEGPSHTGHCLQAVSQRQGPLTPWPCFFLLIRLFWALGPMAQPACCHSAFLFHVRYSGIVIFLLLGDGISFKISLFICILFLPCYWSKNCEVTELSQSLKFP